MKPDFQILYLRTRSKYIFTCTRLIMCGRSYTHRSFFKFGPLLLSEPWRSLNKDLETFPPDFGPQWRESLAESLQICWLHIRGVLHRIPKLLHCTEIWWLLRSFEYGELVIFHMPPLLWTTDTRKDGFMLSCCLHQITVYHINYSSNQAMPATLLTVVKLSCHLSFLFFLETCLVWFFFSVWPSCFTVWRVVRSEMLVCVAWLVLRFRQLEAVWSVLTPTKHFPRRTVFPSSDRSLETLEMKENLRLAYVAPTTTTELRNLKVYVINTCFWNPLVWCAYFLMSLTPSPCS